MIDLTLVIGLAIQAMAQLLAPVFMAAAGFVGALFGVLLLILWFLELLE